MTASSRIDAGRLLRAAAVVHPVPSAINAAVVAALAIVASGDAAIAAVLALAMLGFQASIGALNDIVDAEADRQLQRRKPIAAGVVPVAAAAVIVVLGAAVGLGLSASFGPEVVVLGLSGYACGVAYDLVLRRGGLGWLCYAAAFPLLLVWTWVAAAGTLPPGWPFVLPVAALAGPAIHLANSLVDAGTDPLAGRTSLATRLGPRRSRVLLTALTAAIVSLAWATLASVAAPTPLGVVVGLGATASIGVGLALSWRHDPRALEAGWLLQAVGVGTMAVAWLSAMPPSG